MSTPTLGRALLEQEHEVARLVRDRLQFDWVLDTDSSRSDAERAIATRELQRLNRQVYDAMRKATDNFTVFLEHSEEELAPYGLKVRVRPPRLVFADPMEWVSPEFSVVVNVHDSEQVTEGTLRFRVDVREPLVITEQVNNVSFMPYSRRDTRLTPGNLLVQALYPQTHFEESDFQKWRDARLEMFNA